MVCKKDHHKQDFIMKVRRSTPDVFPGKGVLKICSKFTGEYSCRSVQSYRNHTLAWVFPCKFAAYFQNTLP